jgi:NADH-quinone oxidoreductase subunit C
MFLTTVKAALLGIAGASPVAAAPVVEGAVPVPKGYDLDVTVPPATVVAAAGVLDRHGFFIEAVTGVDWLAEQQFEVVYDFCHAVERCRVVLRLRVDRASPQVPTISGVFAGAEWHERETRDFFGIVFTGLEHLGPLLLPEDADFHPLRKDYAP